MAPLTRKEHDRAVLLGYVMQRPEVRAAIAAFRSVLDRAVEDGSLYDPDPEVIGAAAELIAAIDREIGPDPLIH
jgi:hypothetical protein